MIKLSEVKKDELLVITPKGYDCVLMDKEEFLESSYYIDKDEVKVTIADEVHASFDLEVALENIEDEMHEDWLGNVLDAIPCEVKERIEKEINSYLHKEPTYFDGEAVVW